MTQDNPDTDTQSPGTAATPNPGAQGGVLRVLTMDYREAAQFYAKHRQAKRDTTPSVVPPEKEEESAQDASPSPSP